MTNALTISDVTKTYPGFLLDHVSFMVPEGCIVGLIGENGAGKSTIINASMGLIAKDEGRIVVLGDEALANATKEEIGVVFDGSNFPEMLTPRAIGRIMANIYQHWDAALFEQLLQQFGLPQKKLKQFSKGMKMKIGIAVAMSHHPKLLILDEATSGLDPVVRDDVLDFLNDFTRDEDHAVLVSSHIVSDLERLCDYIAYIDQGSLKLYEEKDCLIEQYGILKCSKEELKEFDELSLIHI